MVNIAASSIENSEDSSSISIGPLVDDGAQYYELLNKRVPPVA